MENRTDKNSYTIIFAIVMVFVVGALLAFTASSLKPRIAENQRIEKQQNILYAMGVNDNTEGSAVFVSTEDAPDLFEKYITKQIVIENGTAKENDQAYLMDIKKEKAAASSDPSKRRLPLFVGEKDGESFYVIPVYGKGLWDAIWGYVSVNKDMVVQGAYFDHKGETPGLGANIKERFFMDDFIGEHLLDDAGNFKGITVSKSNADPKNEDKTDNEVDAIAGATITGDGVTAMLKSDLKLYKPYFDNLKNN
ncbi:Na(+)-translocating NADH-quinone reductase subunit C [Formosa algae]|uniref:Na(+)-translocating NADH-quinone reductase subunit C n=1 Tax=Formosa algae TaxID=225843 RepID=A0A9X1C8D0_9FLAO|nr:Na(+)-translocating NADH-quinone reductase subunit C [Formosa algae]MBP1839071.1 Na+-transporting NADH:ubiquinone oxidoreductase subunit C [Formosa algae]MDQ0333848.1 Na+-transporting NADH:ubiquinone oxidoreductase subunit C [Formosa algae]OEI80908.1 Na(+)-translocating NADH-quinone reductase subunit C [Formosa algae]PNW26788.1 Na(+)-translocating NADH-quinone reductase subunit C [Formosa algae]